MLLGRYKVEPDNLHASPVGMVYVPSSLFLIMLLLLEQQTNPSELPSKDLRTAPHVVHMVGEEHLRSAWRPSTSHYLHTYKPLFLFRSHMRHKRF